MAKTSPNPRAILRALLDEAIAVAKPERCLPLALEDIPEPPSGRVIILGAGKAAAAMARAVDDNWADRIVTGLVVTRYGHALPGNRIEVVEAAHPVPDTAGARAAARMLDIARVAGPEDLVLFLLSGGASALLSAPAPGLTLADKQAVTTGLLAAGAEIHEINTVRKHLSSIKGGRLAAAIAPARLVTLAISDVVGDDPGTIGSGPTVADTTTLADASAVIAKYGLPVPASVIDALKDPQNETLKKGDPSFDQTTYKIIARPSDSLAAASELARSLAITPISLGDSLTGEARLLGEAHAGLARTHLEKGRGQPVVLLSGGETTVTIAGSGKGGPNTEYLLALAQGLDGAQGIWALAADTDGADGSEDNAGAIIGPDTLVRAAAGGLPPAAFLADNDAWSFFDRLGDLVVTGPTQTNVNDFRAILII